VGARYAGLFRLAANMQSKRLKNTAHYAEAGWRLKEFPGVALAEDLDMTRSDKILFFVQKLMPY